jgi:carbamoyl-phosphate synthase large subunit
MSQSTPHVSVLVTGVGGGGVGEQIIKSLRSLQGKFVVYGTDIVEKSSARGLVNAIFQVPRANDEHYMDKILQICHNHKVQVLLYGSEAELLVLSRNRKIFEEQGIFLPLNPQKVIDLCMNKMALNKWLLANGFDAPKSHIIEKIEDLAGIDYFPLVLKPYTNSGGSANVYIAQDKNELEALAGLMLTNGLLVMTQEYVGTPEEEYTVGILLDGEGAYVNGISVHRQIIGSLGGRLSVPNRTHNRTLGERLAISSGISQGEVGKEPNVIAVCKRIATALGAKYSINIQCRVQNKRVYVFEINPRFSGTTSIRSLMGFNEVEQIIDAHLNGIPMQTDFPFRHGQVLRRLEEIIP